MEVNVWVAPIAALVGTALGAWLLDHFSGKRWLEQQQWAAREKYYVDLLTRLTTVEMSLQQQSVYYEEPGSEYHDHSKDEKFARLSKSAYEALQAVEEIAGPARLFLSQDAIDALQELVREDWHAAYATVHPGEYIDKALPLVQRAAAAVLTAAQAQLNPRR